MLHIGYEEYKKFGGQCAAKDFPMLLLDCESYLEKVTFGTINDATELTKQIKRLIVKVIDDVLFIDQQRMKGVASYGDGIENISFNAEEFTEAAKTSKIKKLCIQYLPEEMLYRGVR